MDLSPEIKQLVEEPNFMILGTLRHDNTIQLSVVWYVFVDGKFLISTTTDRAKYKNILKNPQVTFVIVNKDNPYQFIQVRGTTTSSKENAHELIDNLSQRYTGEKPYPMDPEHKEDRVIISIIPEKFTAFGF